MFLLSHSYWEIQITEKKGRGVFAKKKISKGTVIGDFIGLVVKPWEVDIDENNFYLMYYHDKAVVSPDEKTPGVHYLNHSCTPNAWLYIFKGHTLVFALSDISKGEELTISYLLSPKIYCKNCVHICHCKSETCSGTMHTPEVRFETWREITQQQSREMKRERIRYGKKLRTLMNYPKKIPKKYIATVSLLLNG